MIFFSFIVSFLCFKTFDEQSVVGPTARLTIDTEARPVSPDVVWRSLRSYVTEHATDLAVRKSDPDRPDDGEVVYVFHGGGRDSVGAVWLEHGYPWFSRDTHRTIRDAALLPRGEDPRNVYYLFGSAAEVRAAVEFFAGLGLTGYLQETFSVGHTVSFFLDGDLLWCVVLSLLMSLLLIVCGVLFDAKKYAIQRLHGYGPGLIYVQEMGSSLALLAGALGALSAVVAAGLWWYDDLHSGLLYFQVAGAVLAAALVPCVAVHLASLAIVCRVDVLAGIKGRLPLRSGHLLAYAARVPTLLLGALLLQSLFAGIGEFRDMDRAMASARTAGDSAMAFLSDRLMSGSDSDIPVVGEYLRAADGNGRLLISVKNSVRLVGAGRDELVPMMIVNRALTSERSLGSVAPDLPEDRRAVDVIIPASRARDRDVILSALRADKTLDGLALRPSEAPVTAAVSFGSTNGLTDPPPLDPVVVVCADGSAVISAYDRVAALSRGEVLFRHRADALAMLDDPAVGKYIVGIESSRQLMANQIAAASSRMRLATVNMIIAGLVLLISALASALIHVARHGQRNYVRHLSGWRLLQMALGIFVLEAAIALGVTAFSVVDTLAKRSALENVTPRTPPSQIPVLPLDGWDAVPVALLAAASLGTFWLIMRSVHLRAVRSLFAHQ